MLLFFLSCNKIPTAEELTAKHSLTMPATEPHAISYTSIQVDIGNTNILESLGLPIKKLTTAMQDAIQVNIENTLFQVKTVETIATIMNMGSPIIPFLLLWSRLTNMSSLRAAITQTTAPE